MGTIIATHLAVCGLLISCGSAANRPPPEVNFAALCAPYPTGKPDWRLLYSDVANVEEGCKVIAQFKRNQQLLEERFRASTSPPPELITDRVFVYLGEATMWDLILSHEAPSSDADLPSLDVAVRRFCDGLASHPSPELEKLGHDLDKLVRKRYVQPSRPLPKYLSESCMGDRINLKQANE